MKRQYDQSNNTLCIQCTSKNHKDIEQLIATSPYKSLLSQREYVPLTKELCELMNRDWKHYPQIKYFTAVIMAGSILLNTNKSTAIMINTVKIYGQTKAVDCHCESFGTYKNGAHMTSLPPPLRVIHSDVWPVYLVNNGGSTLIIGTQVSNALATSSIRLDEKPPPSVSGVTDSFILTNIDSFANKIFVDLESAKAAQSIFSNSFTKSVSNTGILSHRLRQLRTRFELPNTYTLIRALCPLTKNHT